MVCVAVKERFVVHFFSFFHACLHSPLQGGVFALIIHSFSFAFFQK